MKKSIILFFIFIVMGGTGYYAYTLTEDDPDTGNGLLDSLTPGVDYNLKEGSACMVNPQCISKKCIDSVCVPASYCNGPDDCVTNSCASGECQRFPDDHACDIDITSVTNGQCERTSRCMSVDGSDVCKPLMFCNDTGVACGSRFKCIDSKCRSLSYCTSAALHCDAGYSCTDNVCVI